MVEIVNHNIKIGAGEPLAIIAGPCVIESREQALSIARQLVLISVKQEIPIIFKASYDKANRSSVNSFRGPGIEEGLKILAEVKKETGLALVTDIHSPEQASMAGEVVDILQIPAFLCRQTDLLIAAAKTQKIVNIKKGQFVAPINMKEAVEKVKSCDNQQIMLTERGSSFGYNNLVVDMRGIAIMKSLGVPVVFDATHSVQIPGGAGATSGGERQYVPMLGKAAIAAGADAIFMEIHPNPDEALCDGPNSWPINKFEELICDFKRVSQVVR